MAGKYTPHHAKLPDRPGTNWVEKAGGLPPEIDAVARALRAKGYSTSRAVATAVNHVKSVCATGRAFGGKTPVSAEARAKACSAVSQWEAMKASTSIPADVRQAIELAERRYGVVDMAFNPDQPRDPLGRWREVVAAVQALGVGEKKKVGKSFEVEKVADKGDRKYRVTMKTPPGQDDRRVYAETAADAADAALGVSPAEASSQAARIRSYDPKTGPSAAEKAKNAAVMHGGRSKQATRARKRMRGEMSVPQARAAVVELSRHGRVELERVVDMAAPRAGLVPVKVKVTNRKGTTFERTMYVRPNQAKSMQAGKGPAEVTTKGREVQRAERQVLEQIAAIPRDQRPAGWDRFVRAVAEGPSHGGRLGPEKRRLLRDLQANAPDGSPLKSAVTGLLKADAAPKAAVKSERTRKKAVRRRRTEKKAAGFKPQSKSAFGQTR